MHCIEIFLFWEAFALLQGGLHNICYLPYKQDFVDYFS
jgi:hypothetical protein